MGTTVLLALNQLSAKTRIGKWGRGDFLMCFFSLASQQLSYLVQIIKHQIFQKAVTLQVVTRDAGTEVSGNLMASFMRLTRTEILKTKPPTHQYQNACQTFLKLWPSASNSFSLFFFEIWSASTFYKDSANRAGYMDLALCLPSWICYLFKFLDAEYWILWEKSMTFHLNCFIFSF